MKFVGKTVGKSMFSRREEGRLKSSPAHNFPNRCIYKNLAQKLSYPLVIAHRYIKRLIKANRVQSSPQIRMFDVFVGKLLVKRINFFYHNCIHLYLTRLSSISLDAQNLREDNLCTA